MKHLPEESLARISSPDRERPGLMAMLECYFDDSGTHKDSPIVTWGGLMGTSEQWSELDRRWRALLAEPLPGKPPLKQFHLSHCAALEGEFRDYKRAESDRVRYLFREIIVDSKLESYAYSVSVPDYEELVRGKMRSFFGSAEKLAIMGCLTQSLIRANERREEFVSVMFDRGRWTPFLDAWAREVQKQYKGDSVLISIASMPVACLTPLQSADTTATESWWYAMAQVRGQTREFSAHLASMLGKMDVMEGFIMDREHIKKLVREYHRNPRKSARVEMG